MLELVCRTRPMRLSNHGLPSSWAVKAAGWTRHGAQDCIRDRALTGGPPAPPSQGVPSWALRLFSCSPCPTPFVCVSLPVFFSPFAPVSPSLSLVSPFPSVSLNLHLCLSTADFFSLLSGSFCLACLSYFCFLGLPCLLLSLTVSLSLLHFPPSVSTSLSPCIFSLPFLSLFLSPSSFHRPHGDTP